MIEAYSRAVITLMAIGLGVFFLVTFAIQFAALETGFRLGHRQSAREAPEFRTGVATLTAGMLGLLGFTLGLTISIAQTRYEARRDSILTEANAIGTAWLRAGLIPGVDGTHLRQAIETYAKTRLAFAAADSKPEAARETAISLAQQTEIWTEAEAWARANPTPLAASLIAALNDMIDASLSQRFTFSTGVPPEVGAMLLAGGVLALGAMGYQLGLERQRRWVLTSLLLTMWSGGMTVTADLSNPRQGHLLASTKPLLWTIQGFATEPTRAK